MIARVAKRDDCGTVAIGALSCSIFNFGNFGDSDDSWRLNAECVILNLKATYEVTYEHRLQ